MLDHPGPDVRYAAVLTLGSFGPIATAAIPRLWDLLDPENEPVESVRLEAQKAIYSIEADDGSSESTVSGKDQ